jgi:hypothetical protein
MDSPCWNWPGPINKINGYGYIMGMTAHRLAYIRSKGPVPDGYDIDHLCRNRSCVNPDHLEAVTRRDNIRRGARTKLNPDIVKELRVLYAVNMLCQHTEHNLTTRKLAELYNIGKSQVHLVVSGQQWEDIR